MISMISWTQRRTNVEVLREMCKEYEVIKNIEKQKLQYLGHIMQGQQNEILSLIMLGKITGKGIIGRRVLWLGNLRNWYKCSSTKLGRAAVNIIELAAMISNLLRIRKFLRFQKTLN